jgi:hypothetical protein
VRLLGQLAVFAQHAGGGELVGPQAAALAGQGAAEDAVVAVQPWRGGDRQLQAAVADLAAGADGFGLGGFGVLAGVGEEPLGVVVAAGGLVQPALPPTVVDHQR